MILRNPFAHFLLVSSLAACLSVVGIAPFWLGPVEIATGSSSTTAKACCCGPTGGECRGKACCGAVPSGETPKPYPNDHVRPSLPDLLVATQPTSAYSARIRGRAFVAGSARGVDLSGKPTLQTQQVRIQT
ncbi:MAG TPA: hypothetical protein VFT74_22105 [Isosphaeraceae bacterium]|nr:hypothetical protein [Isosphaeraceae bacterium]